MDEHEVIPTIKPITQSILLTVKKMLGIAEEYHAFDLDVIININSVFLNLNQLGVGPSKPFQITGVEETWSDFLGDQEEFMAGVQSYVYIKVRLLFDPPTNSFLVNSFQEQIKELEWRFTVQPKSQKELDYVESFKKTEEIVDNIQTPDKDQDDTNNSQAVAMSVKRKTASQSQSLYDIFS